MSFQVHQTKRSTNQGSHATDHQQNPPPLLRTLPQPPSLSLSANNRSLQGKVSAVQAPKNSFPSISSQQISPPAPTSPLSIRRLSPTYLIPILNGLDKTNPEAIQDFISQTQQGLIDINGKFQQPRYTGTLVHHYVELQDKATLECLLNNLSASANIPNSQGAYPLEIAFKKLWTAQTDEQYQMAYSIIQLLMQHGTPETNRRQLSPVYLMPFLDRENLDLEETQQSLLQLTEQGTIHLNDLFQQDGCRKTLVHYYTEKQDKAKLRFLLKFLDASVDLPDSHGQFPFDIAVDQLRSCQTKEEYKNSLSILWRLIGYGQNININRRDQRQETIFHVLLQKFQNTTGSTEYLYLAEIAKYLMEEAPDISIDIHLPTAKKHHPLLDFFDHMDPSQGDKMFWRKAYVLEYFIKKFYQDETTDHPALYTLREKAIKAFQNPSLSIDKREKTLARLILFLDNVLVKPSAESRFR